MTLKQFATGVFYLPAAVFSGLTNLFLGSYAKDKRGNYIQDEDGNYLRNRGLIGLTLDAVKYLGTSVAHFISNHQKAISVAFWSSLVVAGAAALTVAFWPAALAAVVNFSVFGVSIASVVGAGYAAQVAATAGVAAALTSTGVYIGATVVNGFNAFRECISKMRSKKPSSNPEFTSVNDETFEEVRRNQFSGLNKGSEQQQTVQLSSSSSEEEPVHTTKVFPQPKNVTPEVVENPTSTVSLTGSK
ncbi:TPA: lpg2884 family Dot/Icm T4SS effector [Legionella pneumophila]|uniref:lpg2884 family Dot/Icm T4SS effector n=1 Tax=Legionella TaxID=445 RepID=UPI000778510D|nr:MULTISPECIES: lpg2884 family Dot/Icm T4SS effector [Legionella]HAT8859104.1 lpg2884 family Dot/Icm T4SS effector [Legionella pneumophila subsp. pneumophila]MCW8396503.1 lpg2884 family Dot/Icm T4SS effector [Legionella sp. PATHC039]HAT7073706.1 lpg2884 family Dot/Icm T4SS effector [Legionella pneumophila]HAT8580409.1 lpg2884 family Dot/Icm T4SS effector [Legionella pneumophila]HAT8641268.1 lpg2884 family Dot/Icm T4SS effector [Legionella pneumophila]